MKKLMYPFMASFFMMMAIFCLAGCSDDGDSNSPTTHQVYFQAEASAGSSINQVVYGFDTSLTTATSLGGMTWKSAEITVPATATVLSINMNAIGVNASSTLKVQIYVDGVLKKEATGSGTALIAQAQYSLR